MVLHNRLLVSLLHNASSTPQSHTPTSPLNFRKRKRVGIDDADFDIDDTFIEPKARVQQWMMGISGRERARMRRAVFERENEEDAGGEDEEGGGASGNKKWSSFSPSKSSLKTSSSEFS